MTNWRDLRGCKHIGIIKTGQRTIEQGPGPEGVGQVDALKCDYCNTEVLALVSRDLIITF